MVAVCTNEDIIFLVKFGSVNTSTAGRPPIWLADWWKDFGLNKEEDRSKYSQLFYSTLSCQRSKLSRTK
jgi:hypothetical protein